MYVANHEEAKPDGYSLGPGNRTPGHSQRRLPSFNPPELAPPFPYDDADTVFCLGVSNPTHIPLNTIGYEPCGFERSEG